MSARFVAIAFLLLTASTAASKQPDKPPGACHRDFEKFCAGEVVCGKGACHDCLNAHMTQLDRACSRAMQHWDQRQEAR